MTVRVFFSITDVKRSTPRNSASSHLSPVRLNRSCLWVKKGECFHGKKELYFIIIWPKEEKKKSIHIISRQFIFNLIHYCDMLLTRVQELVSLLPDQEKPKENNSSPTTLGPMVPLLRSPHNVTNGETSPVCMIYICLHVLGGGGWASVVLRGSVQPDVIATIQNITGW